MNKIGIIGCGSVGASCAYALMESALFTEIVLIDVSRDKAEGEAMDLSHCLPFIRPMEIYAGDYPDLKGCEIIIVTAGVNQKPGETRLDTVHKNAEIFKDIIPSIVRYNTDGILLIVSNPVDVLSYVAQKISGLPPSRVFGSGTVLDSARLKYLLGTKLNVDPRSVHAFIMGEHGDSELAVWSSANISGIPLSRFCALRGVKGSVCDRDKFYNSVRNSAYEIIKRKGVTCYGISFAVRRICECVVRDEHGILPVSNLVRGHYGLDDVYIGAPCLVGKNGVEEIFDIDLDKSEQADLINSANTLKSVIASLSL